MSSAAAPPAKRQRKKSPSPDNLPLCDPQRSAFELVLEDGYLMESVVRDFEFKDMFDMRKSCPAFRDVAKMVYINRVNGLILTFFFPEYVWGGDKNSAVDRAIFLTSFWTQLDQTHSGIINEVIAYMFRCVGKSTWFPASFDIAVPCDEFISWDTFIHLIGTPTSKSVAVPPEVSVHITQIQEYVLNKGRRITITVTAGSSAVAAAISAPHTSNIRMLSKNFVSVYYAAKALESASMDAWYAPTLEASEALHTRGDRKSADNCSWALPCKWNCPVLWRHVSRDKGALHLCLAPKDGVSMDSAYLKTSLKWRLGDICQNSTCPNYNGTYYPPCNEVHVVVAMRHTVQRLPWCESVVQALRAMDYQQLLVISISTTRMGTANVRSFMKMTVDDCLVEEMKNVHALLRAANLDHTSALDLESLRSILKQLLFPCGSTFAAAPLETQRLCAIIFQYLLADILRSYGLGYGDIKLLQAATGTLISGSIMPALLHSHFVPNDIDFYCGQGLAYDVTRYLQKIGDFVVTTSLNYDYEELAGIRGVTYLQNAAGMKLNVVETYSDHPIDNILAFHSTAPRGVISWNGAHHFEVNRMHRGLALITPSTMRFVPGELESHVRSWTIIHKYMKRGFRFVFEHDQEHVCGEDVDCPATLRNTADAGCLHIPLLTTVIPHFSGAPFTPLTSWSVHGSSCTTGRIKGGRVRSANQFPGK
ncbi:hypothetical protein DFH06DRAFT_1336897 [Mycena polygramma]|nr:hypothetical protein DFH06DRAFT_1336897 [Mycena polygramma]